MTSNHDALLIALKQRANEYRAEAEFASSHGNLRHMNLCMKFASEIDGWIAALSSQQAGASVDLANYVRGFVNTDDLPVYEEELAQIELDVSRLHYGEPLALVGLILLIWAKQQLKDHPRASYGNVLAWMHNIVKAELGRKYTYTGPTGGSDGPRT
jgi:hypothetical protein